MNNLEQILFEQYFQITGYKGQKIDQKYLHLIINILLNSKELENQELLTLNIKTNTHNLNNFSFYVTYYDKNTLYNKDMSGTIILKANEIYLIADTYDFHKHKNFEIGELFKKSKNKITRFTTYGFSNNFLREEITKEEFEKSKSYIEDTLVKITKRGR